MLSWTAAGAVSSPLTLQVRLEPRFSGRVPAGAPAPARALTDDELRDTLHGFTVGRAGPRTRPVQTLVLSGVPRARAAGVAAVVGERERWGLARVVLHAPVADAPVLCDGPLGERIDAVAVRSHHDEALAGPLPVDTHVVVLLEDAALPNLGAAVTAARAAHPTRLTLTWPFPAADVLPPPPAARVVEALLAALDPLEGAPWGIKGLPLCALAGLRPRVPDLDERVWRSSNRFYVDADHQGAEALTFFPDVVRFAKRDRCRFCALDTRCDGVVAEWLAQGLAGALVPLR